MSLVEILVGATLLSGLAMAFATMMTGQSKESRALSEKLGTLDVKNTLIAANARGLLCSFAGPGPGPMFNSAASPIAPLSLNQIFEGNVATSPVLLRAGTGPAGPNLPSVVVSSIQLIQITNVAPNQYQANLQVSFDNNKLVRPLVPLVMGVSFATTGAGANTTILGCFLAGAPVGFMTNFLVFKIPGDTSWTVPSGVSLIKVEAWGAGGGGGGARWDPGTPYACGGGGGGGGGYVMGLMPVTPGQKIPMHIGSAGMGGAAGSGVPGAGGNAGDGTDGQDTSFNAGAVVAKGGLGGTGCAFRVNAACPVGCTATGGGNAGGCTNGACMCTGCADSELIAGQNGSSAFFNYTSDTMASAGAGGSSPNGGAGCLGNAASTTTASPGGSPGGGGGGGAKYNDVALARPGSDGGSGQVIVWW